MMFFSKKLLAVLALLPGFVFANEGTFALDRAPERTDMASLQNGAKLFVNYCLNCHSASSMRYNRLRDLGSSEDQIKNNLLFSGEKVGDMMTIAMRPADAKSWFGAVPPDLSVITRARASSAGTGPNYIYTYLRTFYKDDTRPTGWNNLVVPNVAMPHVLWQLQGMRGATIEEVKSGEGGHGMTKTTITYDAAGRRSEATEKLEGHEAHEGRTVTLGKASGGQLSQAEFDNTVSDLVAFMTYMADPSANFRHRVGVWVLIFLSFFTLFAWNLNRLFWKDVK